MKTFTFTFVIALCFLLASCNTSESLTDKKEPTKKSKKTLTEGKKSEIQENPPVEAISDSSLTIQSELGNNATNSRNTDQTAPIANSATQTETNSGTDTPSISTMEFMATEDLSMRATSSRAKQPRSGDNKASMNFEEATFDFGTLKSGEKVKHHYKFTNTGNAPLIIHNATSTCGCTVPEIPLEPISPDDTGSILVYYDSTGKIGTQNKTITIQTNGNPPIYQVYLKGLVVTENNEDQPEEE